MLSPKVSERIAERLGTAYADAGVDPIDFPEAPTHALPIALKRAGLSVDDIAQWEINEAFSVVVRVAEKVLQIDPAKINVNGLVEHHLDVCRNLISIPVQWCCRSRSCYRKLRFSYHRLPRSLTEVWRVRCCRYLQRGMLPPSTFIFPC